jgi:hypothetical protein
MIIEQWRKNAFGAQESQTDSERHGYLELARTWLEAASNVDCSPGILALPSWGWR